MPDYKCDDEKIPSERRDLVKAGSVDIAEDAQEHVWLCFVAKNASVLRLIFDAGASSRHFLRPPAQLDRCSQARDRHVEIHGAPGDAQNWFVGSADIKNAFHQMRIPGWLHVFFTLPAVLASEVGYARKTIDRTLRLS